MEQTDFSFHNDPNGDEFSNPSDDSSSQEENTSTLNEASEPDPEYVEEILRGAVGISKGAEVISILIRAERVIEVIEPIGAALEVVEMFLGVWEALDTPGRICGYQGLVYGLMYHALDMGDPSPNPTWPNLSDVPDHDERFFEGVSEAKERLSDGQDGVRIKNLILLSVALQGEKKVLNKLWQSAVEDKDHLLKMYTIEWPKVGPNG